MRDRLIEILLDGVTFTDEYKFPARKQAEYVADRLLANGVIVPPCKVGDTLYEVTYDRSRVLTFKVESLSHLVRLMEDECFGEWVFTTKAEAEKALAEREGKG